MLAATFINFFTQFIPDYKARKYILAVSGGMDSMLMLHLFKTHQLNFVVAHCNFNLRGDESKEDEDFVKQHCEKEGIQGFIKHFDTLQEKEITHEGTQLLARKLRYEWFEELRLQLDFDFVCTAHHQRDQAETLIQRFMTGAFPESMQGIKPVNINIIRPLLDFDFVEMQSFVTQHQIVYRTDSSNLTQNYTRNKIRHVVLPSLEKVFGINSQEQITGIVNHYASYFAYLKQQANALLQQKNNWYEINLPLLRSIDGHVAILYEAIKNFGYNWKQCEIICKDLNREQGNMFESNDRTYNLFFAQEVLQLVPVLKTPFYEELSLAKDFPTTINSFSNPICFKFCLKNQLAGFKVDELYLDYGLLENRTLILRSWTTSDVLTPLGMNGKKRVGDLLKDLKLTPAERQYQLVLCSEEQIVAVIGHRIHDAFKITENTQTVLIISQ